MRERLRQAPRARGRKERGREELVAIADAHRAEDGCLREDLEGAKSCAEGAKSCAEGAESCAEGAESCAEGANSRAEGASQ
eukprot:1196001-Prorocentrum_minimum.AAC.5